MYYGCDGILTLSSLIKELKRRKPNAIAEPGWNGCHSYRGFYNCLSFNPDDKSTAAEMLQIAKSALGKTFTGYKGGEYIMDANTECFFAYYGDTGQPLTLLGLNGMFGDKM